MRQEIVTNAVLLHSVAYREADRIVTLLTPSHGCVSAIAFSARRSQRRFGGALEPFSEMSVVLARARGSAFRLASAHVSRACAGILGDLQRMNAAGAALQTLRQLLVEQDPDAAVYEEVVVFLTVLDRCAPSAIEAGGLAFLVRVLALCGWAPDLDKCGGCGRRPRADQPAGFDPAGGHLICRLCGGGLLRLSASARNALATAAATGSAVAERLVWDPKTLQEMAAALAGMVRVHAR